MRILVVGAGAVGGWFGGQLAGAERNVTFLVRGERARILRSEGLRLEGLDGPSTVAEPQVVTAAEVDEPYDIVLLSVKSFGLDGALADLEPAIGPDTSVVPMLNGLRHIERLVDEFGERVVGGLCFVATELTPEGVVRQVGPLSSVTVGALETTSEGRAETVHDAFEGAGFEVVLAADITQALWEKWFILAAGGALTTLLRGDVGRIVAVPGGLETARAIVAECAAVAAASGHAPSDIARARALKTLTQEGSTFTTSMYRDLVAGNDVESGQILGDLVVRAGGLGVAVPLLTAASAGLEVYRAGRPD